MSRIGNKPVEVPGGVKVNIADRTVTVEGPLGKLDLTHRAEVTVAYDDEKKLVTVSRENDERSARAFHGLTRALLQNMMVGVTQGYERKLELQGVGYVAAIQNNELQLRVGLANELQKPIPEGLTVTCPDQQHVHVKGIDKQQVGQFAAEVRALRKAEPYKGKGIRYEGEVVRRKQGKVMAK
jgi:large subunit ribosomal protein L6